MPRIIVGYFRATGDVFHAVRMLKCIWKYHFKSMASLWHFSGERQNPIHRGAAFQPVQRIAGRSRWNFGNKSEGSALFGLRGPMWCVFESSSRPKRPQSDKRDIAKQRASAPMTVQGKELRARLQKTNDRPFSVSCPCVLSTMIRPSFGRRNRGRD